jgi:hypothetical protein
LAFDVGMKMLKFPVVKYNAMKANKQKREANAVMDFDEVMRRAIRVAPEKAKKPAKRKQK